MIDTGDEEGVGIGGRDREYVIDRGGKGRIGVGERGKIIDISRGGILLGWRCEVGSPPGDAFGDAELVKLAV